MIIYTKDILVNEYFNNISIWLQGTQQKSNLQNFGRNALKSAQPLSWAALMGLETTCFFRMLPSLYLSSDFSWSYVKFTFQFSSVHLKTLILRPQTKPIVCFYIYKLYNWWKHWDFVPKRVLISYISRNNLSSICSV